MYHICQGREDDDLAVCLFNDVVDFGQTRPWLQAVAVVVLVVHRATRHLDKFLPECCFVDRVDQRAALHRQHRLVLQCLIRLGLRRRERHFALLHRAGG